MHPQFTDAECGRFWAQVDRSDPDGCWPWTRSSRRAGYGQTTIRGQKYAAPRLAYALTYGSFPDELDCLHHCDNPRCCRPDHLFIGTAADNVADMVRKGRYRGVLPPRRQGTAHHWAKLSDEQVYTIRARADAGHTYAAIAQDLGVSRAMVSLIARRRNWRHLPEIPAATTSATAPGFLRATQATELVIALAAADDGRPLCCLCGCTLRPGIVGRPLPYLLARAPDGPTLRRICGACAVAQWPLMWQVWQQLGAMGGQQAV